MYKELSKFQIFNFWRLTWESTWSMGNYKKCDILETAGRGAKSTKIWASGANI